MKRILFFIGVLVFTGNAFCQSPLDVRVSQIEKVQGEVGICIYNSESSYMNSDQAVACEWVKVNSNQLLHRFDSMPNGTYAIVVFQDLNGNKIWIPIGCVFQKNPMVFLIILLQHLGLLRLMEPVSM